MVSKGGGKRNLDVARTILPVVGGDSDTDDRRVGEGT